MLSCNDQSTDAKLKEAQTAENERLEKENDSLRKLLPAEPILPDTTAEYHPPVSEESLPEKAGIHPISLHWLGWDHPGKATVSPAGDGWYRISGKQQTSNFNYLKMDGKIRRLSEKELEFDGTIETRTETNYGGKPCIKTGLQRFFGKGDRTYFRLQNMENCMGESVVDYVDIYPGNSGL